MRACVRAYMHQLTHMHPARMFGIKVNRFENVSPVE